MNTAIMQFLLCAVGIVAVLVLVLTGHDGAQGTIALTAGVTLMIGILFRDATGRVAKEIDKKNGNEP